MSGKHYFLYVNKASGKRPNAEIEQAISQEDWARFRGGELYIIFSEKNAVEIRDLVQPLLDENDHILVGEFNKSNHSGRLSTTTVDWLKKRP